MLYPDALCADIPRRDLTLRTPVQMLPYLSVMYTQKTSLRSFYRRAVFYSCLEM